ncbi:MAG: hypothetical protein ACK5TK_02780 [Betaproteobacteria bacterium]
MKRLLLCLVALALPAAVAAQVLNVPLNGQTVRGSVGINDRIEDTAENVWQNAPACCTGAFAKKIYTAPAGVNFRLTDMTATTRRANTSQNICFFELWTGNDSSPTSFLYTGIKLDAATTWDRSWVSGPPIGAGNSLWIVMYTGQGPNTAGSPYTCVRLNAEEAMGIRYGIRGFLFN